MQAVLTVAGQSSRLYPYGGKNHKSTIPLLGKPLIVHTLDALEQHGITDVVIIDSPDNGVRDILTPLSFRFPVHFVSHEGARGMGEAILDAKELLQEKFLVVHAHHVEAGDLLGEFLSRLGNDNFVLVKQENDVSQYGAVKLDGEKIVALEEKPKNVSGFTHKIVGFYHLTSEFVSVLSKTEKHHYSFEDALAHLSKNGKLKAVETEKDVLSFKYPFHLFDIGAYLLDKNPQIRSEHSDIHPSATLSGKVILGDNVKIMENVVIKGPCFLGDNVLVGNNAVIRSNVIVEHDSTIGANMEIKESILMSESSTHSGYIGNSVVGSKTKIAAQFTTGNVRLDRKPVRVTVKNGEVDSKRNHLGVFIGNNARIGINVSTMPGVIIGNNSTIGPQTVVMQNVPDDSSYYSKFDSIVEKKKTPEMTSEKDVILFDIDYTLFDTGKFKESDLTEFILYDEVIDVLHQLGQHAVLGIFSEGELDFQKAKLVNTMIHAHFSEDHLHIVSSKNKTIAEVLKQYEKKNVILVDDKIEILEMAKKLSPHLVTIWVKRGPFASNAASSFSPDVSVETLDEILEVIKRKKNKYSS